MKTLEELMALAVHLEALADPEQEAVPSYENTDWRGLANTCAHALRELIAGAERNRTDAERYRWAREHGMLSVHGWRISPVFSLEWDNHIDAARKG